MTYKTKNLAIVFAFAAVLLAWPMATQTAHAVGGNGVVNDSCGIDFTGSIDLGTITVGTTASEVLVIIPTDATIPGTFELISTDWTGVGTKATGSFLVLGALEGNTITINGQTLTGSATPGANEFLSTGSTTVVAAAIATAINADTQTTGEDTGSGIEVTAFSSLNAVLLTAKLTGTTANGLLSVASNGGADINIVTATLAGGTATGATIMQAERVKVTTQTQSEGAPGTAYTDSGKIALGAATVNVILTTETDPDPAEDIDLYFHIDGVSVKASETITILAGLVDDDTITIDGVEFRADSTLANVVAANNDFFTTEGTVNTDATALAAAINAAANVQFTASASTDTVTVTAKKGGLEDNAMTLAEVGGGVTLGDSSLNNGDEIFDSPYSGAISATYTFGTACDT